MKGSCLCGAIRFEVTVPVGDGSVCHCTQCRKQTGHFWASTFVPDGELAVSGEPVWYASSEKAKRGFCGTCGSFLFWKHDDDDHTSFSLGAIDGKTGLRLYRHIFTASKGDYYDLDDDLPKS